MNMKKTIKYTVGTILSITVLLVCNFLVMGNFHQVDKDVYRSAQLFSFNMPYYVEKHGIKSIVNLRNDIHKDWYKDEKQIAQRYNIQHINFGFSDGKVQSIETMGKLVELIKNVPKPVLIHCKAGADRTSLASALYLHQVKKDSNAQREISLRYGHFPWLGSRSKAMDISYDNFVKHHSSL